MLLIRRGQLVPRITIKGQSGRETSRGTTRWLALLGAVNFKLINGSINVVRDVMVHSKIMGIQLIEEGVIKSIGGLKVMGVVR